MSLSPSPNVAVAKQDERYDVGTHFDFGRNWAEYARLIGEDALRRAEDGLLRLLPYGDWQGKKILDIGCGSGLHAAAMLRLGAEHVTCLDIDSDSVVTAAAVLAAHAPPSAQTGPAWDLRQANILDETCMRQLPSNGYDIVYSWGVLHHTGDLHAALRRAASCVGNNGIFIVALYKKTPLCAFWAQEKRLYTRAPAIFRKLADYLFAGLYLAGVMLSGKNPFHYVKNYGRDRGMDFMTDIRDWLGGYPYESIAPQLLEQFMAAEGFQLIRSRNTNKMRAYGMFGSGCAEYVFRRL